MTTIDEKPSADPGLDLAIEITGLTKRFGPTVALDRVDLRIRRGRSCALLGRNGAGKSTLIAALAGGVTPDAGSITVRGSAQDLGEGAGAESIAVVYQKSTLVPGLTAAENIWLGNYPRTRFGSVDWRGMRAQALELLEQWGIGRVIDQNVESLEPVDRKIIEVCRALSRGPSVLLLDEPTAGLDEAGCVELFEKIQEVKKRGVTIIYVSHYLEEVFEVCDEAVVLRDGRVVLSAPMSELTVPKIVDAMVGNVDDLQGSNDLVATDPLRDDSPVILTADGIAIDGSLEPTSLALRAGEIVGMSGLEGAGHVSFAEALVGLIPRTSGELDVLGTTLRRHQVSTAIKSGIGFVPEDRHESGFAPEMSVEENATMSVLDRIRNRFGLVSSRRRRDTYNELARAWEIRASSPEQPIQELSGGNQQKVVMARALASNPKMLVLINPTAGVDVMARASIYSTIQDQAKRGCAVLIISSDEVDFRIAHRVVVMFKGRVHRELPSGFTEKELAASVQGD